MLALTGNVADRRIDRQRYLTGRVTKQSKRDGRATRPQGQIANISGATMLAAIDLNLIGGVRVALKGDDGPSSYVRN